MWTNHILLDKKSLVKQLGVRLNVLGKICLVANFKTRKMVADGIFMSKLTYLIPLWGGCEDFLLRALQVVQNRAARLVAKGGIYSSSKDLLNQCGWLSVNQLVFFHTVLLLFKVRKYQKPRGLFQMAISTENRRYGARSVQAGKLRANGSKIPVQVLNFNSFKWRSVRNWNLLPVQLRQMENLAKFKTALKTWVKENVQR